MGLRYVPYKASSNQCLYNEDLNQVDDNRYWPITTAYCEEIQIPEEEKRIEVLDYLKTNGFNVRQVLA
jgi:hypothetical protein